MNEKKNIDLAYSYYTASYSEVYNIKIDANVTTVQNIPGIYSTKLLVCISNDNCPGIPLSKLVESDKLLHDTKYRACLHRCVDLLVFKFFQNLVQNGFYHGDLHAGNIFYSYKHRQLTLIDFGAVGNINIFENNNDTLTLINIIVMSLFYNYDEILDTMTDLMNSKCIDTQIDKTSKEYNELKKQLYVHRINNIRSEVRESEKSKTYERDVFSNHRINDEISSTMIKKLIIQKITIKMNLIFLFTMYSI